MADSSGQRRGPGDIGHPADRGARRDGRDAGATDDSAARAEAASELEGLRREIDALDARIVTLLNERARLGRAVGHAKAQAGWSGIRDPRREREVLLRVSSANGGPLAGADLVAIYRRVIAATRALEDDDRRAAGGGDATAEGGDGAKLDGPR
jgi:chorismate mutase/prephenate dehydratase